MKFKTPRFYQKLAEKWAEKWEVIRAKGEQSRFVLMIDDVFTGYDAKSLRARSFILSGLVHVLLIFPPAMAVTAYTQTETQKIEIRFGTEQTAEEQPAVITDGEHAEVEEEIKPIVFPKDTDEVQNIKPLPVKAEKPKEKKEKKKAAAKGTDIGKSNTGEIAPEDYLELLQYSVQEMSYVPGEAEELRGIAVLRLTFNRQGYVQSYKLHKSTGHQVLDDAAISVAQRLMREPFPAVPAGFDSNDKILRYDFRIKYPPDRN